jgi:cell division septal protein FtsQ
MKRPTPHKSITPKQHKPLVTEQKKIVIPKIKFKKKNAKQRKKYLLIIFLAILIPVICVWLFFFSNIFVVKNVKVTGLKKAQYVNVSNTDFILNSYIGEKIGLLNTKTIEKQINQDPAIESSEVKVKWPNGLQVKIIPRKPIAVIKQNETTYSLIDKNYNVIKSFNTIPADLPILNVPVDNRFIIQNTLNVLSSISNKFKKTINTISSPTQDALTFVLKDSGRVIVWGNDSDNQLKEEDVWTLLKTTDKVIDVSSPTMPVTRKS